MGDAIDQAGADEGCMGHGVKSRGARDEAGERSAGERSAGDGISPWEWLTAAAGALLVAAVVAFLAWQGLTVGDGPPRVTVSVERITEASDGYLVRFIARNEAPTTATALTVEAVLTPVGGEEERLQTVLDYLPGRSSRRGGFIFTTDPRRGRLELRAVAYQEP